MKIYAVFRFGDRERELVALFSDKKAADEYQAYLDSDNDPEELELDTEKLPDWWDTKKSAFTCMAGALVESSPGVWRRLRCDWISKPGFSVCGLHFTSITCRVMSPGQYEFEIEDFDAPETCWDGIRVHVIASDENEAIDKASKIFTEWIIGNQETLRLSFNA